ncbi:hypothetical protein HK096_006657 [Nowakowskiella sp. JEL0078]|nr:hypothetical protein HK096_006657 [Nowakowskiella sp. JEL0078]
MHLEGSTVEISMLSPRQDLITTVTGIYLGENYDSVSFEVDINPEASDNFLFFLCPSHKVKEYTKDRWDIENFGKLREIPGFPNRHYTILSDTPDFAKSLVSDPVILKALWASLGLSEKGEGSALARPLIQAIEITDLPKVKPTR